MGSLLWCTEVEGVRAPGCRTPPPQKKKKKKCGNGRLCIVSGGFAQCRVASLTIDNPQQILSMPWVVMSQKLK